MTAHRSHPPREPATAGWTGALVAVVLLGLGVTAVVDVVLARQESRDTWSRGLLDSLDGLTPSTATTAIGVVLVLLGVLLVVAALRPRRQSHLDVDTRADLWLTPGAVGSLAARVAQDDPEVLEARVTRATRRRVVLGVTPRDPDQRPGLAARVRSEVDDRLAPVNRARFDVREEEGS